MSSVKFHLLTGLAALTLLASADSAIAASIGEIIADQVNVRSGPSTNYYVVTTLGRGDRVQIVDEDNDWHAIIPPPGCYSLISSDYVRREGDGVGIVTGYAVRVRAGSDVDSHRYAVQLKLDEGVRVQVLGDAGGGYLKIAPPEGAHVWIHGDFISVVESPGMNLAPVPAPVRSAAADGARRSTYPVQPVPAVTQVEVSTVQWEDATRQVDIVTEQIEITPAVATGLSTRPVTEARAVINPSFITNEPAPRRTTYVDRSTDGNRSRRIDQDAIPTIEVELVDLNPAFSASSNNRPVVTTVSPAVAVTRSPQPAAPMTRPGTAWSSGAERSVTPASDSETVVRVVGIDTLEVVDDEVVSETTTVIETVQPLPADPRERLAVLDDLLKQEMAKPIGERQLGLLIDGYTALAEQDDDQLTKLYAERRFEQLKLVQASIDAVQTVRGLRGAVSRQREQSRSARGRLYTPRPLTGGVFDAEGELHESMIFSSPVGPRRYRLIDPELVVPRTLCYLELPPDTSIDISDYLGRIVGVKARRKYVETGNVNLIPIIIVERLTVLDAEDGNASANLQVAPPSADGSPLSPATPGAKLAASPMVMSPIK